MRLFFMLLLALAPVASATSRKSADVAALSNVMSVIKHYMKENGGDCPSSWQEVRSQIPAAASILDQFPNLRIEDRYAWVPGRVMLRQYPQPKRLLAYSRWLEVTGPLNDERIERRIVLMDEEDWIIMPSRPDTEWRSLVSASGHDPNALFGAEAVYLPGRGPFKYPGARKKAIIATGLLATCGLGLWIWIWTKRRSRSSPSTTPDAQ